MKAYWIVLRDPAQRGVARTWGVTARDRDDALLLINEAMKGFEPVDETMIETWKEVHEIKELDQNHVVPNMGVIVRRGIWYPNFLGIT